MWRAHARLRESARRCRLRRLGEPARRLRRAARKVAAGNRCRTGSKTMSGKVSKGRGKKTSRAAGMICRRSGAMEATPGPSRVGRPGLVGAATLALSVRPHAGQTATIGRDARARGKMTGELEPVASLSTINGLDVFSRKRYTSASKRYCASSTSRVFQSGACCAGSFG